MRFLAQLFGQDVVDRLASAGYDSGLAIAHAGPERLSSEAGVPLPLARRIVAVAMEEAEGIEEVAAQGETATGKRPARPGRPRRTAKKPESRSEVAATGGAGERTDDSDPFVDEVGLVTWMGFSAKHGAAGVVPFSVADGILDPPGPAVGTGSEGTPSPAAENPRSGEKTAVAAASGSFWSFGVDPRQSEENGPAAGKKEDRPAGSPAIPRRRFYDEQ